MPILIAGLVAVAILFLLPRFLGRRQERMLKQYDVLEKRFGLSRRVSQSRWGKGIGENFSLHGASRGYPLSLYSHFVKVEKARTDWTSLVFEVLFTEELEFSIEFPGTEPESTFSKTDSFSVLFEKEGCRFKSNEDLANVWNDAGLANRYRFLSTQASAGSVRLSKGFLEYREVGFMEGDAQRLRFQEAILLLASLCDALSVYMSERKAARGAAL